MNKNTNSYEICLFRNFPWFSTFHIPEMLEKISSSESLLNFSSNSDWVCLSLQPVLNCIKIFTVGDMPWWSPWFFLFFAPWFLYNIFLLYYLVIMHVYFLQSVFLLNQKVYNEVSQFISVTQLCLTLCDPMNLSTPGLPIHHHLLEFTQTHVHRVGDAIQPSHPLSSPFPPGPNPFHHQSLFQWVNPSHEVAKVLEFQL